jgi:ArsR family transcriptional regulator, arsenate/arsenite/antimonite-responsive transcriptional repressor
MPAGPGSDLERAAALFHALADETRLAIVGRLREGERCVCDLTDILETAQSRLSFHLKTLKDAGILRDRRQGRWVYYSLNPGVLDEVTRIVGALTTRSRGLRMLARAMDRAAVPAAGSLARRRGRHRDRSRHRRLSYQGPQISGTISVRGDRT